MSVNLLLEKEDSPVIWRGPIIAGTVKQFWTDVIWGDVDFLFLDMPPGTGDVHANGIPDNTAGWYSNCYIPAGLGFVDSEESL